MRAPLTFICLTLVACNSGSNSSKANNEGPETETSLTGSVAVLEEMEINDDISVANPVTVPTPLPSDDFVGFQVKGVIDSLSDRVDVFAFTASRSDLYAIELCSFACGSPAPGSSMSYDIGYYLVLDQSGEVLLTSKDQNGNVGNFREFFVDAGVLYYVAVRASDTFNGTQNYSLYGFETAN